MEADNVLAENQHLRAAIEQRTAELAVVNAVQQALAAELDMQGIYDAVGDKLREIFHDADLDIRLLDPDSGLVEFKYVYHRGERLQIDPIPVSGIFAHVAATGMTLVINEDFDDVPSKELGASTIPGSSSGEKSAVWVPLVWRQEVRGLTPRPHLGSGHYRSLLTRHPEHRQERRRRRRTTHPAQTRLSPRQSSPCVGRPAASCRSSLGPSAVR